MSDIVLSAQQREETKPYEQPDAGAYAARCVRVCDLGTHENAFFKDEKTGKPQRKREVEITFELSELMEDGRPFVVSWRGGLSFNEKANLRKMLKSWRGKDFSPDELAGFSLSSILDKTCFVNVIHRPWKSDATKFSVEVESVMPLPKGMRCREQVNDLVIFSIKDIGTETFEQLWPRAKKRVMESFEYKEFLALGAPMTNEKTVEPPIPF